mmetsp:Transcript_21976/g.35250  ORF Transcript_21976/g.35250 Transcript_21976/m.35250 type:complete len:255 (+) Transcript_21976:298-1062(+)
MSAGVPQHTWQDASGIVLSISSHPGAWHTLHALRELPEHGVRSRIEALLVQNVEALQVYELRFALVQDLEELRISHRSVRTLVLVVMPSAMAVVLLSPVKLGTLLLIHDTSPPLRLHELDVGPDLWVIVFQHVVIEMQGTGLLQATQDLVEPGLDSSSRPLHPGQVFGPPRIRRQVFVDPDGPHPNSVPDLRQVVIAGVHELVASSIASCLQTFHDQINLSESTGVGLSNGPDILQEDEARSIPLCVIKASTQS